MGNHFFTLSKRLRQPLFILEVAQLKSVDFLEGKDFRFF